MFDGSQPPHWDNEHKYTSTNLELYYEDYDGALVTVNPASTLHDTICNSR